MVHRSETAKILLDMTDTKKELARLLILKMRHEDTSATMTMVGTKFYIAPEVFRGERYGASADIFSLGVILNELDTLQRPGTGVNFVAMNARNPGSFRPLYREDVPVEIKTILVDCLRFDRRRHGPPPQGDLSYGRPTIEELLRMIEALRCTSDADRRNQPRAANDADAALLPGSM